MKQENDAREYDFSNGLRGRYAERYRAGANVVVLEPDVAKFFRDSSAVNEALRDLLRRRTGELPRIGAQQSPAR